MKQLELCDDGRVIIRNRAKQEWVLERPTLGEYRVLVEKAEAADAALRAALEGVEDDRDRIRIAAEIQTGSADGSVAPLYGALVREFIELLCEEEPPDVADLPSWAVAGTAVSRMIGHWRAVPLDLGQGVPAR